MDGTIIGGIVSVTIAIVGGPYAWSALRDWMRTRATEREAEREAKREAERAALAATQAERTQVDEAEARLLTRLETRVTHLEAENAKLHAENRELVQRLDEKNRELAGVRAAYVMISEQHAILAGRVQALETTIETLNAANAKSLERAIAAALSKRDSQV